MLCFIWILGAIISLVIFIHSLHKQWHIFQKCTILSLDHDLYKLCSESSLKLGFRHFKGTIRLVPQFTSPGMIGLFKPNVLLPSDIESFPSEYLPYIFYHELYHFKKKDTWILLGAEILRCLLWWNLAVYFLKDGIEHMLELRCDKNVCSILKDLSEKELYAATLIFVSKKQLSTKNSLISGYTGKNPKIVRRFEEIFKRNQFKSDILKPCINFFLLLLSIALFIFSYQFIIQPAFTPSSSEETILKGNSVKENVNDNECSFIIRLKDGSLMYFENGKHSGNITEDMLNKEPYCTVPIYDKD